MAQIAFDTDNLTAMNTKQKPPARPNSAPKLPRQPATNPLRQAASRWQRTVRYGWDKGGADGGRK